MAKLDFLKKILQKEGCNKTIDMNTQNGFHSGEKYSLMGCCLVQKEGPAEIRIKKSQNDKFDGELFLPNCMNNCEWLPESRPKLKYFYYNSCRRDSLEKLLLYLHGYAFRLKYYMDSIECILSYPLDSCKDKIEVSMIVAYREEITKRSGANRQFNLDFENLEFMDLKVASRLISQAVEPKRISQLLNEWAPRSFGFGNYGDYVLGILKYGEFHEND